MRSKRILSSFLFLVFCHIVVAQPRSEDEAQTIAEAFLSENTMTNRAPSTTQHLEMVNPIAISQHVLKRSLKNLQNTEQNVGFYVFSDKGNQRFVIVSGDMRQYEVLGSSDNGAFEVDRIPCGLETLLVQYAEEYEWIQTHDYSPFEEPASTSRRASVSSLINTTWDQSPVYNDQCPLVRGKRCVTGCVATAMAQVMNYHQHPVKGEGTVKRVPGSNHLSVESLNLSLKAFDWSSLKNAKRITSSSSSAGKAVAYLMKACGYAVKMDYDPNGSGALPSNIKLALTDNFDYSSSMLQASKSNYTTSAWEKLIQSSLTAKRPIIYWGYGNGGHCFILDGYNSSTGNYHFNWGWDGTADGYFKLSSLRPGNHNYTNNQGMVCNIYPEASIDIATPVIHLDPYSNQMTVTCATSGVTFYYSFTPQDATSNASFQRYYTSQKIPITKNGTFMAYVEKQGKQVYAVPNSEYWFKVNKPEFYPEGNKITIKCPSATTIYYTKDGTTPTKSSTRYTSAITVTSGTTIKAIGVKADYSNSEVASYNYAEEIKTVYDFYNIAGKISEKINNASKLKVISLTVSGQLNGTDLKFIGQMLRSGELSRLDMKNATIVSGGDSYYGTNYTTRYEIGNYMFTKSPKLTSIVLPSNTTRIGEAAFNDCPLLSDVEIPESCKEICTWAFKGTAITSLVIPKYVTEIEWGIVQDCKKLTHLSVDSGNTKYDSRDNCNAIIDTENNTVMAGCIRTEIPTTVESIKMRAFCSSPAKLTIPGNVTYIWNWAFAENTTLEELEIGEGTFWISMNAFQNCTGLKTVVIPASVYNINKESFDGCTKLSKVTTYNETPLELDASVFTNSNIKSAKLYVPYGCKTKYEAAAGWKDFKEIIEMYPVVKSVSELKALDDQTRTTFRMKDAQVIFASSHSGSLDYIYLRDNTGAHYLYGRDLLENLGVKEGDSISGNIPVIKSKYGCYVLSSEFDTKKITKGTNSPVEPKLVTMSQLGVDYDYDLITLKQVELEGDKDFLFFKNGERCVSLFPEDGVEPEMYTEIMEPIVDKELSGRWFDVTGLYFHYDEISMIKLTRPLVETTPPASANKTVTTANAGYATFYDSKYDYQLPTELTAQVVTAYNNNKVTYQALPGGNVVPKGTAVMLVSEPKHAASYTLTPTSGAAVYDGPNLLAGHDEAGLSIGAGRHYKLCYGKTGTNMSNVFGWYWGAELGMSFQIEAHRAWMVVPGEAGSRGFSIDGKALGVETTGNEPLTVDVWTDLQGRRISMPTTKGVYIKNGKKVTIK